MALSCQKYPNKAYLVSNLDMFFVSLNLQLDKLEGPYFKYDNIVFKFQPKNT